MRTQMTRYMPLFRSCRTLRALSQLHGHLLVSGLYKDPLASTKLIESYAQMGSVVSSRQVFETFADPDFFMWGVLMKSFVWNNMFDEAITLYHQMLCRGVHINRYIFPSVLRAFSVFDHVSHGAKLHGRVVKCGFDDDEVVKTSLLVLYGRLGSLENVWNVFDEIPVKDVISWSSLISSCVDNGAASEALAVFRLMVSEGFEPESVTMLSVVDACGNLGRSRIGKSVHGYIVTRCIGTYGHLGNALITMYSKCGDVDYAESAFRDISRPSIASWTAMIACYNQTGRFSEAIDVFRVIQRSEIEPNSVTVTSVLYSCVGLGLLREGKSIHCFAVRKALDFDILRPSLLELYGSNGRLSNCENILYISQDRNVLPWNILISCYARQGFLREALLVFRDMHIRGLIPDSFSLSNALSACGNVGLVEFGHQIHGYISKRGSFDEYVKNSLIDMYCKCGYLETAYTIFEKFEHKSVVTWNSMIGGFSQSGHSTKAINLFDKMFVDGLQMNEVTFLLAVQACSQMGYREKGNWVHHKIITFGVQRDVYIGTALTDMYAKCGRLQTAQRVFDAMPEKSVVSWSVVIGAYGSHGEIDHAISLFDKMLQSGTRPNGVVFTNILSACSHSGYVKEGKFYFETMKEYGIEPNTEHFACIVDLLSRAGDLEEAYEIIKSMRVPVEASIWGTFANGCRIHQRMDMLNRVQRHISSTRSNDSGYYTLLSNIYAERGNWGKFGKLRSQMEGIGIKKVPGYSSIEL